MIDTTTWIKRNLWNNSAGELVVRDGFQQLQHVSQIADGDFGGGFSVENPRTGDQLHYILIKGKEACVCMLDEELQVLFKLPLGKGFNPTGPFQGAPLANGQIIMGAPGMPMLWGYTGSGFKVAEKTESSQNIDFDTLSIPDGLCVSWQGRVVIAARNGLFFSDTLSPRAFLAANSHQTPGLVYFLQVSEAGMLYMGTTEGMYSVAADTVYSGEILQPVFQKISNIPTNRFFQSCLTSKGPVTLSKRGVVNTSSMNSEELMMGDPTMPRSIGEPNHYLDFRTGRIFGMEEGPLLTFSRNSSDKTILSVRLNERQGYFSWLEPSATRTNADSHTHSKFANGFNFQGILKDSDGSEFIMTDKEIVKAYGNVDEFGRAPIEDLQWESSISNPTLILGTMYGGVSVPPPGNPVVRQVITASDNVGSYQYVAVKGIAKRSAPLSSKIPCFDTDLSYNDVAASTIASSYYEKSLQSIKHNFSVRTQNPTIEIGVEGSGFRLGLSDVVAKGPGKTRRVDGQTYNFTAVS